MNLIVRSIAVEDRGVVAQCEAVEPSAVEDGGQSSRCPPPFGDLRVFVDLWSAPFGLRRAACGRKSR